ncbi:MAG TPA: 23S rRNA (guanosine(2251)-2'-O)-methyltransferase RlmB [Thiotrichales bacterium]|nr:23S rRNA (guanosine(2251)-2'-O)-methyltransferase RlmB [Thiotrichales bacterium]
MSNKQSELIYGLHAVESAIRHHAEDVLQLWLQQGRNDKRFQMLSGLAKNSGVSVQSISADKLKKKCPGVRHQGVVAQIRRQKQNKVELEDLLEREELLLLILDEVQDPHNIGACLRTADAAGVDAVIVSKNRSPALTGVIRNVASGGAETVPYIQVSNLARAISQLRDRDVWVVGASGDASTDLYDLTASKRMALVMGSEGKGMRRLTRESCDELIAIPMQGNVESLNVSVATGICLFQIRHLMNTASA